MNLNHVAKTLFLSMQQAGIVARNMQAGIQNEGKVVQREEKETAAHYTMREAKTKIDEIVQEMLLQALYPYLKDTVTLDVEEDTPSLSLYPCDDHTMTLILDPIDGTLPYIQQKDTYSICAGLWKGDTFPLVMVYFPARDILYAYVQGGTVQVYEGASLKTWEQGETLTFPEPKTPSKRIYKNDRLEEAIVERLKTAGYEVVDDGMDALGCPDAILACMRKDALAYIGIRRNLRDIFMGVLLSKLSDGHAYDLAGQTLAWHSHGRQPEMLISRYPKEELLNLFESVERKTMKI